MQNLFEEWAAKVFIEHHHTFPGLDEKGERKQSIYQGSQAPSRGWRIPGFGGLLP